MNGFSFDEKNGEDLRTYSDTIGNKPVVINRTILDYLNNDDDDIGGDFTPPPRIFHYISL